MGAIFSILGGALGSLFGAVFNFVGSLLGIQRAKQLGAAQQQVKVDDSSIKDVAAARAASDAANRVADADPASLRQPDPDSRD